jgi:sugar phosphate isomerase/epimerase
MSAHPLSVQLYTVRDALAADPDAALARIADIGFRTVELFGFVEHAGLYAELLPKHGLVPSSAHAPLLDGDVPAILAAAQQIGITTLIDPSGGRDNWGTLEGVQFNAAMLNTRAQVAADHGVRVGYHNHWWEFESIGGRPALEVFADLLLPEVVLEVDTYWAQLATGDALGLLERLGERVQLIHVKDGPVASEDVPQTAVGSGTMPVLEVLAAAPQAIPVVELDSFDGDVYDALTDSFAFLTAHGQNA